LHSNSGAGSRKSVDFGFRVLFLRLPRACGKEKYQAQMQR